MKIHSSYFNPASKFKPDFRTCQDHAGVLRTILTEPQIMLFGGLTD